MGFGFRAASLLVVGASLVFAEAARASPTAGSLDVFRLEDDPFYGWQEELPGCARLLRKSMPSMGDRARFAIIVPHERGRGDQYGLAHLVEHLDLARGADRERVEIEASGVELNAETYVTFTTYWVEGSSAAVPGAAEALLRRVFSPGSTTDAQVAAHREPLRVEKGLPTLAPAWWTWDTVPRLFYGQDYDLASSLESFSGSDVDGFRRKWNRPALSTFLVVGDVEAVPASVFDGLVQEDCGGTEAEGPSGADAADPQHARPASGPTVRFQVEDRAKGEVRVEWRIEQYDDRDFALARLSSWILRMRLMTELRDRRLVAYSPQSFVDVDGGALEFGVKVRIDDDHLESSWEVMRQEIERLSSVETLPEDEWLVDRATALRFLTEPRSSNQVVEAVQEVALRRGAHLPIPPVAPVVAELDRAEFTEWFARATLPEQSTWEVTRGVHGLHVFSAVSHTVLSAGLFGLGQLLLRRRVVGAVRCARLLDRPVGGWVLLVTAVAVVSGVAGPWLDGVDTWILRAVRDTGVGPFELMAIVNGLRAALTAALLCAASLLPWDLLDFGDHLVVRTFGAYRWSFSTREVVEVRRERLVDLLRRGRFRFRAVPWPAPWSVGTSIRFRDGGVLLLHGASIESALSRATAAEHNRPADCDVHRQDDRT